MVVRGGPLPTSSNVNRRRLSSFVKPINAKTMVAALQLIPPEADGARPGERSLFMPVMLRHFDNVPLRPR